VTNEWWETLEAETAMDRETIGLEAKAIINRLVDINASLLDTLDIAILVMGHAIGTFDTPSNIKKAAYGARHAITLNERIALKELRRKQER
jgi:hypothetical protein